jgi:hypothetical protein
MNEAMIFSSKEKERPYNRMPITVEIDGRTDNVWTRYQLGREVIIADCTKCGKKDQELEIQKPENIEVETSDPEIRKVVLEKLQYLVRTVEERMSVCGGCFDDDFLKKRAEIYITTLEQVQREMGIKVDPKEQREKIMDR